MRVNMILSKGIPGSTIDINLRLGLKLEVSALLESYLQIKVISIPRLARPSAKAN